MKTSTLLGTALVAGALAAGAGGTGIAQASQTAPAASTVSTATAAKPAPGTAFTAYGGKRVPWRATVSNGVLRVEGKGIRTQRIAVKRSAFAKGVEFTAKKRGVNAALVIRGGKCVDASGKNTGQRATLTLGKRVFHGCAVNGVVPIADT